MILRNLNYLKATLMAVGLSLFALPASATDYKAVAEFTGTIPGNIAQNTTDGFGSSVKLNGNWAFVSAPIARPFNEVVGGAIYVYKKHEGRFDANAHQVIALPGVSHHLGLLKIDSQKDWLFISCIGTPVEDLNAPVGDFKGALLVYKLNRDNDQWEPFQTLDSTTVPALANLVSTSPEALNPTNPPYNFQQGASFGLSFGVDVDKNLLIVGAQYQTTDPSILNAGRAYAFKFHNNQWVYTQTISSPDGISANDTFGAQVALKGNLALVSNGSVFQGPKQTKGSTYVYKYKNNQWQHVQTVQGTQTNVTPVIFVLFGPAALPISDTFGSALALSNDWALIGAAYENLGSTSVHGAAYFYKVNPNSSTPLKFTQKVYSTDINLFSQNFSLTGVAIDGNLAVISNVCRTGPTAIPFQGAGNVYRLHGNTWKLDGILTDPNGFNTRLFGSGVDVEGNSVFVGAGFNGINLLIVGTPPLAFIPPPNNLPPFPDFRNAVIYTREN